MDFNIEIELKNLEKENLFEKLGLSPTGEGVTEKIVKEAYDKIDKRWQNYRKEVSHRAILKKCDDARKTLKDAYDILKTNKDIQTYRKIQKLQQQSQQQQTQNNKEQKQAKPTQQEKPKKEVKPKIKVSPENINFGNVNLNRSLTKIVNVTSEYAWQISKQPQWLNIEKQGDKLKITFTAKEEKSFDEDIVIKSKEVYKRISVTANAVAKPEIKFSQTAVNFGKFDIPNSKKTEISVTNTGTGKLEWKISNSPEWLKVKKVSDKIVIEFEPKKENNFNGNIEIESNGGNTKITVNAQVNDPEKPILQINKKNIDFGKISISEKKEINIAVENKGVRELQWHFSKQPTWIELNKAKDNLKINFAPKTDGIFSDTFEITSNAGTETITVKADIFDPIKIRKAKRKKIIIASSVATTIIAIIIAIFVNNYIKQENAWETAKNNNTFESYEMYISKYPTGKYIEKAETMQEDALWKSAKNENTIESFERYISEYSTGMYIKNANNLKDSIIWKNTQTKNTILSYKTFVDNYPNSVYHEKAVIILNDLIEKHTITQQVAKRIFNNFWATHVKLDVLLANCQTLLKVSDSCPTLRG